MNVTTYEWSCDCCGYGAHYEIEIPELNLTLSRNDQFGGKLRKYHDDFPDFVKYTMDPEYVIASFIKEGYDVTVNGYEYDEDHCKELIKEI